MTNACRKKNKCECFKTFSLRKKQEKMGNIMFINMSRKGKITPFLFKFSPKTSATFKCLNRTFDWYGEM